MRTSEAMLRLRRVLIVVVALAAVGLALTGTAYARVSAGLSVATRPAHHATATRTITDMAGRQVTVPRTITKVFGTSPVGSIMVYTLNPKQLLAWNYAQTADEKKYLVPSARNLPNLGGWQAGGTPNLEALIKAAPDFILDMTTNTAANDPATVSKDDKLQAQLHIPFVIVDGRFGSMSTTYAWLGRLMGDQKTATTLGNYVTATLLDIQAKSAKIPSSKVRSVYYAEGAQGLNTEPADSQHARVLNVIKARNVATGVPVSSGAGMTPVSMEQVLAWNPSWIIVGITMSGTSPNGGDAYSLIKSGQNGWSAVTAVKQKHVYAIPSLPFFWFDRPPGVNQVLGMKWAAQVIYPEYYRYDMVKETQRFFKLFYHIKVTPAQVKQILSRSM